MMNWRKVPRIVLVVAIGLWLGNQWGTPSYALTLEEAKSQGLLGELPNGYLGLVTESAPPEAKALMREINRKRREKYEDIARRNGTALATVEALAGKTAIEKTKPGNYVKLPSGQWTRK